MKISVAQINPTVGDITANTTQIQTAIRQAKGADLLVLPELSLCGYPPEDLLFRADFMKTIKQQLQTLIEPNNPLYIVVGLPYEYMGERFNAAAILHGNQPVQLYYKQRLPNHGVFDEKRYFAEGTNVLTLSIQQQTVSLAICEDLWVTETADNIGKHADVIISLNASPFSVGKFEQRLSLIKQLAIRHHTHIVYCNQVGGQDELVFDGGSFIVNPQGERCLQLPFFEPDQQTLDIKQSHQSNLFNSPDDLTLIHQALVLSLRDYLQKNGFNSVILGLSGGIDSALCLSLCVDAIGAENTTVVMMPHTFTSDLSRDLAAKQAELEGVTLLNLPIETPVTTLQQQLLSTLSQCTLSDLTYQNLQARTRGLLLMALSNEFNHLLITTGNKSEMAVGYATLYGDMCGGFAPLKDVSKTLVYQLAKHLNQTNTRIPEPVITRAPSAELAPDQKDTDSLPDYGQLDAILRCFIEDDQHPDAAELIIQKTVRSEYKRRQSPPGPKISTKAFGKERRYPITQRFFK